MVYGEEFQGMTQEMVMVEVATRLRSIETKVDNIKCPSPRCQDHETRLNTLETTEDNRKDSGASTIAWIGIFIAIVAAVAAVASLMR